MPRISTAIQRISQQIRLSLTLAKSSADLRVFISKSRPASESVLIKINSNSKTKAFEGHKFSSGLPQKARCKRIASHSQQHRFQFQKRAQKLIRLDNVAFAVAFVRINNPPSPNLLCNRAAITHDQPAARSLSATDLPVFHWRPFDECSGSIFGTAISQTRNKFDPDNFNHCVLILTASAVYVTIKIRGTAGA